MGKVSDSTTGFIGGSFVSLSGSLFVALWLPICLPTRIFARFALSHSITELFVNDQTKGSSVPLSSISELDRKHGLANILNQTFSESDEKLDDDIRITTGGGG
jgi:hypothetical protein